MQRSEPLRRGVDKLPCLRTRWAQFLLQVAQIGVLLGVVLMRQVRSQIHDATRGDTTGRTNQVVRNSDPRGSSSNHELDKGHLQESAAGDCENGDLLENGVSSEIIFPP